MLIFEVFSQIIVNSFLNRETFASQNVTSDILYDRTIWRGICRHFCDIRYNISEIVLLKFGAVKAKH